MDKASMASVKLYGNEIVQLWRNYCYFLDVLVGILLWRGRANLTLLGWKINVWFPIHSMWLFASVAIAFEKPSYALAVVFYGCAYIMIALNYHYRYEFTLGCKLALNLL